MSLKFDLVVCVAEGVGVGVSLGTTSTGVSSGTAEAISSGVKGAALVEAAGWTSPEGSLEVLGAEWAEFSALATGLSVDVDEPLRAITRPTTIKTKTPAMAITSVFGRLESAVGAGAVMVGATGGAT